MPLMPTYSEFAYQKFREHVRKARTLIDTRPPIIQVNRYLGTGRLREDAATYMETKRNNLELMMRMNRIGRMEGLVDTFHQHTFLKPHDKYRQADRYMRKLEHENEQLGQRLLRAVPWSDTHADLKPRNIITARRLREQQEAKCRKAKQFKVPVHILRKYENLTLPRGIDVQRRLLRPRVYIDLAVRRSHSLGRITIQLYTEASPQVVLEFVRVCSQAPPARPQHFSRQHEQWRSRHPLIAFIRNFPSLWIEGELKLEMNSLSERRIEYDMRALDHNSGPGILSYSSRFLSGFKHGFINFAIAFRPLSVANGKRVAFGRVVGGLKVLDCLQEYGTKNGTPRHDIIVTGCGVLPQ